MAVSMKKGAASGTEKTTSSGMGFLKTGAAAAQVMVEAEAKAKARAESAGKLWRFFIGKNDLNTDRKVLFLDGNLTDDGMLDGPVLYEHSLKVAGDFTHFVCLESAQQEPCPICEQGDRNDMVQALTVLDLTPYTIKKGDKAGQVVEVSKRLYVIKRTTMQLLMKLAAKRGGLAGTLWDVSRTGQKEPNVGNIFDFVEKFPMSEVRKKYGRDAKGNPDPTDSAGFTAPADYSQEFVLHTRKELVAMGLGSNSGVVSGGSGQSVDVDEEL